MKLFKYIIPLSFLAVLACDDKIDVDLDEVDALVSIDAWLTHEADTQVIRVQRTQPYFDDTQLVAETNAGVRIFDENGEEFIFEHDENGSYLWVGADEEVFGEMGNTYTLQVVVDEVVYSSVSTLNRVPEMDSVTFRFEEENTFIPDSYVGEFWARDPLGAGDSYWIKTFKNGELLNKPGEINVAFDAGFSAGGNIDGLIFIQPIRDGVNPFDEDDNDEILSPYVFGDSIYVEIHSISNAAYFFLNQVINETDRPGGFGELFATPLSNVSTNLFADDESVQVVGFFNIAAVSGQGKRLVDESDVRATD